ncbi:TPA: ATP-binding protein [Enterococcus faecalis]|nr:ATP-binding protein [Enterococcus faecalis]
MINVDIVNEVTELIERRTEGIYWDFKQQWYANNADLLHDIICMANNPANRDAYIIIGIEDATGEISDISNDEKRKNQQQVIYLIRKKPQWAAGNIPEIYITTITISEKKVDVIIIKQSDSTPFYLLDDYKDNGILYKGNIYTRKGDTNTPKTETANLYDTEILWKRRFGLLYNPSQRAKNYLMDLKNWERVDGEPDKFGITRFFLYYKQNPDYTIHFTNVDIVEDELHVPEKAKNINDESLGAPFYYLYAFCNVSYHTDFSSDEKATLYYRDIPLFASRIESVDERRTKIIPPEFWLNPRFVQDSFRYLVFEFVIAYWSGNYASEAKQMLLRVVPLFKNDIEHEEFMKYIQKKGYSDNSRLSRPMSGESLDRFNNTEINKYEFYGQPSGTEYISNKLKEDEKLVINFASPDNKNFEEITKQLQLGKMLVDWLEHWRNNVTN